MNDDTENEDHNGAGAHNDGKPEDLSRQEASRRPQGDEYHVVRAASVHVRLVGTPPRPAGTPLTGESPLEWLGLNLRTLNCLTRAGFHHVSDVTMLTVEQLLALRNFSRENLANLRDHLRDVRA